MARRRKYDSNFCIYPFGFRESPWCSVSSLWGIFGHLCADSHGQYCNRNCGFGWSLSSFSYVFLSWHFSFLEIGYTTTIEPMMLRTLLSDHVPISFPDCARQFYFFCCSGSYRMLLTGCNVLWSFHSHLQPIALFQPHGPLGLLTATCCLLSGCVSGTHPSHGPHFSVNILCCQWNWPLLLWSEALHETGLHWYTNSWDNFFYMHLFICPWPLSANSGFLYSHHLHHYKGSFCHKKTESLLYLFLPSDSSQSVLWVSGHCLWISIRASEWKLIEVAFPFVYTAYTCPRPYYLHSKEQGCKSSSEKIGIVICEKKGLFF